METRPQKRHFVVLKYSIIAYMHLNLNISRIVLTIFRTRFYIDFGSSKTDQCSICLSLTGHKNSWYSTKFENMLRWVWGLKLKLNLDRNIRFWLLKLAPALVDTIEDIFPCCFFDRINKGTRKKYHCRPWRVQYQGCIICY